MFFITLYGIPLVVTRGYISSERLEPNQTLQSRKRGLGVREFQQVTRSWLVGSGCKSFYELPRWIFGSLGGHLCCEVYEGCHLRSGKYQMGKPLAIRRQYEAFLPHERNALSLWPESPRDIEKYDRMRGWQDSIARPWHEIGFWASHQMSTRTGSLSDPPKSVKASPCLSYDLHIKASIWLDLACHFA